MHCSVFSPDADHAPVTQQGVYVFEKTQVTAYHRHLNTAAIVFYAFRHLLLTSFV
jgi:hypothetical protein